MALALVGVALVVLGLSGRAGLRGQPLAAATGVGAVAGALCGWGGVVLSVPPVHRSIVVRPAPRPTLWDEPGVPPRLSAASDLAARLSGPAFTHGLPVAVHALPDGRVTLAMVQGPDEAALDAVEQRIRQRVLAPDTALAQGFQDLLGRVSAVPDERWLGHVAEAQSEVLAPALWSGSTETRASRLPWGLGGGALAGALLAWAAAVGRPRSPSRHQT